MQTASRMRGIGRYVTELLGAIAEHHPEIELSISFNAAMADDAILAREAVSGFIDAANIHVWHGAAKSGEAIGGYTPERQLSEVALVHHVNCLAPDVALSTSPFEGVGDQAVPLLPSARCHVPIASIFYDAIPFRHREVYLPGTLISDYYFRRLKAFQDFDANMCISEFSLSEIQSIYRGINSINISAGISKNFIDIEKNYTTNSFSNLKEFILYVGAMDWRKNVKCIVNSFLELDRLWPENHLSFVVAGDAPAQLQDELKDYWVKKHLAPSRLICLGHVSDEELVALYKQTSVLVQPSFMEGFGLTALEAIYCGTPVLAARAGALPEVVGLDELLFNPASPDDLAHAIVRLLRDKDLQEETRRQASRHIQQFTWCRSAAIAVEYLKDLCKQKPPISIPNLRSEIAGEMRSIAVDRWTTAPCLALAEPRSDRNRLLIDVTATVQNDHKTGIQRVVRKICEGISTNKKYDNIQRSLIFCDNEDGWYKIDDKTFKIVEKDINNVVNISNNILLMLDSSWHLFNVHKPSLRACELLGGEVVSCLYDTVPLRSNAMCNPTVPPVFTQWFKAALTYSTGFVCISRAVADELIALLEGIGFPRRMKIGFWQLGADFAGRPEAKDAADPSEQHSQFLMVGTLEPRKGHRVAIEAFEKLWADGSDAKLVIVGKVGWGIGHLVDRIRAHPEFGERLIWHEKVDDDELATLYASCDALIAASFSEGFGLPLVEAGHFGKSVLASDIPVFREVAKGAAGARFFKVGDAAALAEEVKGFLLQEKKRGMSTKSAPAWPSWAESAAQLEDVVIGGNWYRTYEPREKRPFTPLTDLGRTRMAVPLTEAQRAHSFELVEGPYLSDDGLSLKIIVAVTNLSDAVWSSKGLDDGSMGVAFSYHLLDRKGKIVQFDNPRSLIPFVIVPGDTVYLPVTLPAGVARRGAAFADIELVQEGVSWFGDPLRVAL